MCRQYLPAAAGQRCRIHLDLYEGLLQCGEAGRALCDGEVGGQVAHRVRCRSQGDPTLGRGGVDAGSEVFGCDFGDESAGDGAEPSDAEPGQVVCGEAGVEVLAPAWVEVAAFDGDGGDLGGAELAVDVQAADVVESGVQVAGVGEAGAGFGGGDAAGELDLGDDAAVEPLGVGPGAVAPVGPVVGEVVLDVGSGERLDAGELEGGEGAWTDSICWTWSIRSASESRVVSSPMAWSIRSWIRARSPDRNLPRSTPVAWSGGSWVAVTSPTIVEHVFDRQFPFTIANS